MRREKMDRSKMIKAFSRIVQQRYGHAEAIGKKTKGITEIIDSDAFLKIIIEADDTVTVSFHEKVAPDESAYIALECLRITKALSFDKH